ncbi:MAG TPA: hypothetical protein VK821_00540 [Dehalococcoidia bacterium]|nr:hypothetical protein [Dehalococcoidia bacterium]
MKSDQFDEITRSMATARTRRGLFAAFAGGMTAAAFGSFLRPAAGQAVQFCTADSQCPEYERCAAGTCVGALVADSTPTVAPDLVSPAQQCLDGCHAAATACNDRCDKVSQLVRGTCWQRCRGLLAYCVGSCPTP